MNSVLDQLPVAIVTGSGRGIGRAIAERFLAKEWRVVLAESNASDGRKAERDLRLMGECFFIGTDVSREADIRRCVEQTVRRYGRLDGLINNAGIADPSMPTLDVKRWRRLLEVDLTGPFVFSRYAVPHLQKTKGAIVNIASTRALMSEPHTEAYCAAKGGLVALTHALANSFGPDIRVNCISPGWIDTKGEKLRPIDHRQHPVGRVGNPADIAALTHFLCTSEAGFITGQNFVVDGGMTKKMIYAE